MALKDTYNEAQKNKVKDKVVKMTLDDFIEEHVKLVKILKEGSREELLAEAKEQKKELCEYLKEFGIEDEEEDDD
jgi:hypothetical protein